MDSQAPLASSRSKTSRWNLAASIATGFLRSDLKRRGLSPATAAKRLKDARQFFRYAVRKKLVASNPFEEMIKPAAPRSHAHARRLGGDRCRC